MTNPKKHESGVTGRDSKSTKREECGKISDPSMFLPNSSFSTHLFLLEALFCAAQDCQASLLPPPGFPCLAVSLKPRIRGCYNPGAEILCPHYCPVPAASVLEFRLTPHFFHHTCTPVFSHCLQTHSPEPHFLPLSR